MISKLYSNLLKSFFDVSIALILLIILFPVLLFITIILFSSQRAVLFKHQRVGLNGKCFYLLKFRTMVQNADEELQKILQKDDALRQEWNETRKLRDDPRITAIGQFLRKTHLDELPQLINVLRRDLSLVGPRPITEEEFLIYFSGQKSIDAYQSIKPGITGIWTTRGYDGMKFSDRINMELSYLDQINIITDFRILLRTVEAAVKSKGR